LKCESIEYYHTPTEIVTALNFFRTQPSLKDGYKSWQRQQEDVARRTVTAPVPGRGGQYESLAAPSSRNGTVVCGSVSKSEQYNNKLRDIDRKVLAIDTESGGIFAAASIRATPAITIRGISDYADDKKSALEEGTGGAVRKLAALNAASFLKAQLGNRYFIKVLSKRRNAVKNPHATAPASADHATFDISQVLNEAREQIHSRLCDLSPEYRLQPDRYRLPVPRARMVQFSGAPDDDVDLDPVEIRDSLVNRQMMFVSVPLTYPDNSLPWVVARDLLTSEISGRQVIPVVIDGNDIRPPKFGIEQQLPGCDLVKLLAMDGAQVVFVIDNIPLQSRTRTRYLIEQINNLASAKFICLARSSANIVLESQFAAALPISVLEICDVSFLEIAEFLKKRFEMTPEESEVVALRLQDTFKQFDLSAHPAYFAGIPKETLSALLQANRRSELIELAVAGFLTVLVAEDSSSVALSRAGRTRFLERLAVGINVKKQVFDQERLINFTKSFAVEYDFDIDPIEFIKSFGDKGMLHFESGRVVFSLPFVESFLLASALHADNLLALEYFRFDELGFDLAAFDLYAEIGPSADLVERVANEMQLILDGSKALDGRPDILLTDRLQPSVLSAERVRTLKAQLERVAEAVRQNQTDSQRKQRWLNFADQIKRRVAKSLGTQSEASDDEAELRLRTRVQTWMVGATLLGSSVEHLNAATKQRLVSLVIKLGCIIIDEWTVARAAIDFGALRDELISDESLRDFMSKVIAVKDLQEARKQIIAFLDLMEWALLGEPFARMILTLCEQARDAVLATSISKAPVSGRMEDTI
jgi:gas vesicle protein